MAVINNRRMHIMIYFKDSPSPLEITDVCHIGTEGGLLRIIWSNGEGEQWWPLCHVFNIRRIEKKG
jgi:hypothetical protein